MFTPVTAGRISEEIVDQIKAAIFDGRLRRGDRLPSERDLTERFGVSRVTVRDALRILEASGLIEIRVGARGGAVVTAPGAARVGEGISNMLLLSALTPAEVTEARMVFELGTVALICERADDTDIAELTEICERSSADRGIVRAAGQAGVELRRQPGAGRRHVPRRRRDRPARSRAGAGDHGRPPGPHRQATGFRAAPLRVTPRGPSVRSAGAGPRRTPRRRCPAPRRSTRVVPRTGRWGRTAPAWSPAPCRTCARGPAGSGCRGRR